jgi:hypothetical protein
MKTTAIRWTKNCLQKKAGAKNCLQRQQRQKKLFALTKCPSPLQWSVPNSYAEEWWRPMALSAMIRWSRRAGNSAFKRTEGEFRGVKKFGQKFVFEQKFARKTLFPWEYYNDWDSNLVFRLVPTVLHLSAVCSKNCFNLTTNNNKHTWGIAGTYDAKLTWKTLEDKQFMGSFDEHW